MKEMSFPIYTCHNEDKRNINNKIKSKIPKNNQKDKRKDIKSDIEFIYSTIKK